MGNAKSFTASLLMPAYLGIQLFALTLSLALEPHREPTPSVSADDEIGSLTVLCVADLKQTGRAPYLNAVGF
jgi:hypothetical protein